MADIKMLLAGLAAENIWYGREMTSSGATSDLRNATMLAAKMVAFSGQWNSLVSLGAIGPTQSKDDTSASQFSIRQVMRKLPWHKKDEASPE